MLHRGTASLNQQVTFYSGPVAFSRRWVSLFWLPLARLCLRCISSRFTLITEPSNQKQHPETAAIGSSCSATPDCRIASDGWIALPLSFGKSTGSSRYTFTPVEPRTEAPWLMKRLEGVQSQTLKSSNRLCFQQDGGASRRRRLQLRSMLQRAIKTTGSCCGHRG